MKNSLFALPRNSSNADVIGAQTHDENGNGNSSSSSSDEEVGFRFANHSWKLDDDDHENDLSSSFHDCHQLHLPPKEE